MTLRFEPDGDIDLSDPETKALVMEEFRQQVMPLVWECEAFS